MKREKTLLGGIVILLLVIVSGHPLGVQSASAQPVSGPVPVTPLPGQAEVLPGQFIVELRPDVVPEAILATHRVVPFLRYTLINGFAARLSQVAAERLAADVRVRSVSPDLLVHAFPKPGSSPGNGGKGGSGSGGCPAPTNDASPSPQVVPTGVSRSGAPAAWARGYSGAGVKVAVLDTGIDPCQPDLMANYKGGVNLVDRKGTPPIDGHGHGTHVAGIVGASNNTFGVVGVAPQAALYAVKVLGNDGSGSLSTAIKGLEWAVKQGMQVANLSLGAFDFTLGTGPMCTAVTNAVAAGVTIVVAAGNSAFEALYFTPANCVDSLTVSAFVDADGFPGGKGDAFTILGVVEADDTFADSFSNYSEFCWDLDGDGACTGADTLVVNLMAPGVAILSTLPTYPVTLTDEGAPLFYGTLTGTSMATPHIAGAAALYIQAHPDATPAEVRIALTTGGECVDGGLAGALTCSSPWPDDPDTAWEPLLDAEGW